MSDSLLERFAPYMSANNPSVRFVIMSPTSAHSSWTEMLQTGILRSYTSEIATPEGDSVGLVRSSPHIDDVNATLRQRLTEPSPLLATLAASSGTIGIPGPDGTNAKKARRQRIREMQIRTGQRRR